MRLFFDPDLAASYREMTSRLARVAAGDHALRRLAADVSERYAQALLSRTGERERSWHAFLVSLNAFVVLAPATSSHHAALRAILTENEDLLQYEEAQAV